MWHLLPVVQADYAAHGTPASAIATAAGPADAAAVLAERPSLHAALSWRLSAWGRVMCLLRYPNMYGRWEAMDSRTMIADVAWGCVNTAAWLRRRAAVVGVQVMEC
jgi:hypothetical protein